MVQRYHPSPKTRLKHKIERFTAIIYYHPNSIIKILFCNKFGFYAN
ncbi:hypothetical protein AO366_1618 [Moraxella catarrhalis]|nr:hypothetical protein AO368_1642 [Moraxella catarrhalis]OAV32058.1 hypothetical protein AO366_1618 [Moraxella catarrhalis]